MKLFNLESSGHPWLHADRRTWKQITPQRWELNNQPCKSQQQKKINQNYANLFCKFEHSHTLKMSGLCIWDNRKGINLRQNKAKQWNNGLMYYTIQYILNFVFHCNSNTPLSFILSNIHCNLISLNSYLLSLSAEWNNEEGN